MAGFEGKRVLITGAASGIGLATAKAFALAGADLALCDLDIEQLRAVSRTIPSRGALLCEQTDVSQRQSMEALAERVHARFGCLDVLVNNAGVAVSGGLLDTTLEDWEWILGVNLWGVIYGCKLFIPKMVERGTGGHVINVASAAGFLTSKMLSAYGTTKFGVFGLSESLRDELEEHRIGVSTICPGIIDTNIVNNMRLRGVSCEEGAHEAVKGLYKKRGYGPEHVADAILDAVRKNKAVVPVSPEAWFLWGLKRVFPQSAPTLLRKTMAWGLGRKV